MIFNITLGNNPPHLWDPIGDLVWFLEAAIEALGHTVLIGDYRAIDGGTNLFIDRFYHQPDLAADLARRNVRYGLIVTEHIAAGGELNFGAEPLTAEMTEPIRHAAFVWCLIEESVSFCRSLNTESWHMPLGYVASLVRPVPRLIYKDIDFVVTGRSSERRRRILGQLDTAGFQTTLTNHAPRFVRDSLLARSKFNLSLQKIDGQEMISATRICHSIMHRVPVILEAGASARAASRYGGFCLAAEPGELIDRCIAFAHEVDFIDFANRTLDRFERECDMVASMKALVGRLLS
jgi:hypothetical protein